MNQHTDLENFTLISLTNNKAFWGKGIGYECNRLILEYAFRIAKMNGVYQYINPCNTAAWKNALKLGFNDIGTSSVRSNIHIFIIKKEQWIKE